jgi:hypothetical protein
MVKGKPFIVLIASVIGVLCRETLLILPFVYILFCDDHRLFIRISLGAAAFSAFLLLRYIVGWENYDHAEGLRWNLHHLEQVIGFTFITFGFLWLPFLTAIFRPLPQILNTLFHRSAGAVLFVIWTTTFLGGIFNEIRLLFLLAPWVIIIGLTYFQQNKKQIIAKALTKRYQISMVGATVAIAIITILLLQYHEHFLNSSRYGISYTKWILITSVQFLLFVLTIPLFRIKPSLE